MDHNSPSTSAPQLLGARPKKKKATKSTSEEFGRVKGVCIVKPMIYGSIAKCLGVKQEGGHIHRWTVYIKPYRKEKMSHYVKHVQFRLPKSYATPIRIVSSPPYVVAETGGGEFDVGIKLFFQDSKENAVEIQHSLKLFLRENGNLKCSDEPLQSEFYDELIFQDPTVKMHKLLMDTEIPPAPIGVHSIDYELKKVEDLKKIIEAKKKVKQEIEDLKKKLAEKQKIKQEFVDLMKSLSISTEESKNTRK